MILVYGPRQAARSLSPSIPIYLEICNKKFKKLRINPNSDTGRQILENLDIPVKSFIAKNREGSINREFPSEFLNFSVEEALRQGGTKVRKLLTDGRFAK